VGQRQREGTSECECNEDAGYWPLGGLCLTVHSCGPRAFLDFARMACACEAPFQTNVSGLCVCPSGLLLSLDGTECVEACPTGAESVGGQCACEGGRVLDGGACVCGLDAPYLQGDVCVRKCASLRRESGGVCQFNKAAVVGLVVGPAIVLIAGGVLLVVCLARRGKAKVKPKSPAPNFPEKAPALMETAVVPKPLKTHAPVKKKRHKVKPVTSVSLTPINL